MADDPHEVPKFLEFLAKKPGARALRIRRAIALLWNEVQDLRARVAQMRPAGILAEQAAGRAARELDEARRNIAQLREVLERGVNVSYKSVVEVVSWRVNARTVLDLTRDRPALSAIESSTSQVG